MIKGIILFIHCITRLALAAIIYYMIKKITFPDGTTLSFIVSGNDVNAFLLTDTYQQCRKLENEIKRQQISCGLNFVGGLGWYVRVKRTDMPMIQNIL